MTDEQSAEEQVPGPGAMLKQARIDKGLSQEEVASRLNLRVSNVQDLEAEHFDKAISVTFIRGYLKAYAKLLEISVDEVLKAYERLNTATPEPAKLQSFSRKMSLQADDDKLMLVSYLILAIILALVVVWWFQQSDSDILPVLETESSAPATTEVSGFEVQEQNDIAAAGDAKPVAVPGTSPNPAGEQQNNEAEQNSAGQTEAQTLPEDSAQTSEDQQVQPAEVETAPEPPSNQMIEAVNLVFEFSDECWVNIVDATGEAIAYGVKAPGRVMPVSGIPPFEVTLGAPEVVNISYADKPVDMSGFSAGRTARFSLPLNQ